MNATILPFRPYIRAITSWHDSSLHTLEGVAAEQLRDLANRWVRTRLARGEITPGSAVQIRSRLESLLRVTERDINRNRDINRDVLEEWQASIGHLKPATRHGYVATVGQFCEWLVENGHLTDNPRAGLTRVKVPRGTPRALPSPDVEQVLKAAPDERWAAVVAVMLGDGLRCVEVARLDLADWDRERGTLYVVGKGGHTRILPVPTFVGDALAAYIEVRGTRPGPLFLSDGSRSKPDRRMAPRWISRKVALIMRDAGVHDWGDGRSAHALRHTCLSDALDASKDIRVVQQIAGHQSLATTQVYLRVAGLDQVREALEGSWRIRGPTIRRSGPSGGAGSPGALSPAAPDPTWEQTSTD